MTPIFTMVLAIAAGISILLLIIIIRHARQENNTEHLFSVFYEVAAQFNFLPSQQLRIGNSVLGLDEISNRLLYFCKTGGKHDGYLIELAEIKSVWLRRDYALVPSQVKYFSTMYPEVHELVLQLDYKNGAPSLDVPFYSKGIDAKQELKQRLWKAKEWQLLITGRLTKDTILVPLRKKVATGKLSFS